MNTVFRQELHEQYDRAERARRAGTALYERLEALVASNIAAREQARASREAWARWRDSQRFAECSAATRSGSICDRCHAIRHPDLLDGAWVTPPRAMSGVFPRGWPEIEVVLDRCPACDGSADDLSLFDELADLFGAVARAMPSGNFRPRLAR